MPREQGRVTVSSIIFMLISSIIFVSCALIEQKFYQISIFLPRKMEIYFYSPFYFFIINIILFQLDRRSVSRAFGFFLQCNGEAEAMSWSCTASAVLTVLAQKPGIENHVRRINHTFYQKENDWGYSQFLPCEV